MRDRQDDDEAGLQRRIAGGDETGRAVLTLVAADRGLPQPQVIVSDNEAGLRLRHRHGRRSLHQLVERRMLTVHLGAFDSLDHDRRRVSGPMGPSGGCHEPVIMIGRHQHELPAAVPGDLYGLAQRLVLELAEFPLELHRGRLRHHRLEGGAEPGPPEYTYYPLSCKGVATANGRPKLHWEPGFSGLISVRKPSIG